ncbi:MAG: hypothetical protein WBP81_01515 [Solirubrobacteraceae bacterium]
MPRTLFSPALVEHAPENALDELRHTEVGGRQPYRFQAADRSVSGRWEMWMDGGQARVVRAAQRAARSLG